MIVFAAFCILTAWTLFTLSERKKFLKRKNTEWALDFAGLFVQGVAIPALQIALSYYFFSAIFPSLAKSIEISSVWAFLLNIVGVDYLYYWNHRALHSRALWPAHWVHHASPQFDVFITGRNTLWTPLMILYLWVNGFFIYALKDPFYFALGASLTAALDLWRHTRLSPKPSSLAFRILNPWLMLPVDHSWHHSSEIYDLNFGANFKLWDKIHRTYHAPKNGVFARVGTPIPDHFPAHFFWPYLLKRDSK